MEIVDLKARVREKTQQPPEPQAKQFAVYFKEHPEAVTQVKVVEGFIGNLTPLIITETANMDNSNVARFILPYDKLVYLEEIKQDATA